MIRMLGAYFLKKSFIIYGLVGGFVTIVQISILYFLRNYYNVNDFSSITIAYIVALLLHYFLNKHITFLIKEKRIFNWMSVRYLTVVGVSYLIYVTNIFLLNRIIGLEFAIALIITLAINYVINYILYEKIVFIKSRG